MANCAFGWAGRRKSPATIPPRGKVGRQARRELESFLKEQPEDHILLGNLALTDSSLGDKAAAFGLAERAMAAHPMERDAVSGARPLEILARVAANWAKPTVLLPRFRN